MKKLYIIWFVLGISIAFLLRLFLLPYGNHNDLITNTGWSEWIYIYGTKGFYENRFWVYDWPTQLPLMNLIYDFNYVIFGKLLWLFTQIRSGLITLNIPSSISQYWFDFVTWFGWTYYFTTPYMVGHILSMKLIPILSDIGIGLGIFLIGSKHIDKRKALITSLLYLFIPFAIYVSALWGQYDQTSALTILLSFYFVFKVGEGKGKRITWLYILMSVVLYFASVEIKPTAVFTLPFYAFYLLKQKPKWSQMIASALIVVGLFFVTTTPFTSGNPVNYTINTIFPIVFNQARNVLSTQVFNFWQLIHPTRQDSATYLILGVSATYWGYLILILLNVLAIKIIKKANDLKHMFLGLFVTTAGSYIFAISMLDRYYFAGLVFFLILTMYYRRTVWLWLGAAILFGVNLFTSWGFPLTIPLRDMFWTNYPVVRLLSLLQTLIFLWMAKIALKDTISFRKGKNK